tara:strand:+ start:349 stop:495 length:147 start_codon:yes stop_codon:yes gene_type:complete
VRSWNRGSGNIIVIKVAIQLLRAAADLPIKYRTALLTYLYINQLKEFI